MRHLIGIVLLCLASLSGWAEERSLRIVELRHSLATPVLEILRPHLPAGAGASAVDNKLLLNLTEREWEQIQNVIGQLDKPPIRLLVTVRWQQQQAADSAQTDASVSVGTDGATLRVNSQYSTQRDNDDNQQQVHTLSGQTAFIHTGTDIPLLTVQVSPRGELVTGTSYRSGGRGFYVLPVVQNDQVFVRINPQERVPVTAEDGSLHISALETEVRGPLGDWLPLGSTVQTGNTRWQTQRGNWSVQLKVDRLP